MRGMENEVMFVFLKWTVNSNESAGESFVFWGLREY